jgi:hypothetical protein
LPAGWRPSWKIPTTYLLHSVDATVFQGRAAVFFDSVAAQGLTAVRQQVFSQRDGTPLYEIWKVQRQQAGGITIIS